MKNVELAQSLAAAMQLRLPGTAGRVARKMRYIDEVAPRFRAQTPGRARAGGLSPGKFPDDANSLQTSHNRTQNLADEIKPESASISVNLRSIRLVGLRRSFAIRLRFFH